MKSQNENHERSAFSREDAVTILKMESVCFDEGTGPCTENLLDQIAIQHPDLKDEWDWMPWPEAKSERTVLP